jgi:hypothetical protein
MNLLVAGHANRGEVKEHLVAEAIIGQVMDLDGRSDPTPLAGPLAAEEDPAAKVAPLVALHVLVVALPPIPIFLFAAVEVGLLATVPAVLDVAIPALREGGIPGLQGGHVDLRLRLPGEVSAAAEALPTGQLDAGLRDALAEAAPVLVVAFGGLRFKLVGQVSPLIDRRDKSALVLLLPTDPPDRPTDRPDTPLIRGGVSCRSVTGGTGGTDHTFIPPVPPVPPVGKTCGVRCP